MPDARLSTEVDSAIVPAMTVSRPRLVTTAARPARPARRLARPGGSPARRAPAAVAVLLCLTAISCSREGRIERVEFPATPVLSVRSTWAAVASPLLRVREQPDSGSTVLQHIRQGVVVEVIGKSDREDEIEGQQDYWYRINYDGLKGWVFGSYLVIKESRGAAEAEAARLR